MRAARAVLALSMILTLGVLPPPGASANNTHIVGEWGHGLGDGKDGDFYVHPFNDNKNGHSHQNRRWLYRENPDGSTQLLSSHSCTCVHNHVSWDTSPLGECNFYSSHESYDDHILNKNTHYHHNECVDHVSHQTESFTGLPELETAE